MLSEFQLAGHARTVSSQMSTVTLDPIKFNVGDQSVSLHSGEFESTSGRFVSDLLLELFN